ncbi:hypothetical protein PGRAN_13603 [Listeria grandensis FSL F6-0971]|uniref:Uncharacterized protein n=1 Tax=Listeria grandensis FSL F6-0971 TaxID=1265819 RepID=W7BFJ9_9LIST|nr:hypothetical protein [Listeria grandensis]EUJ21941.1 hypothetical protein PGRAN_13603 [Listeria grandensis FSL F6-0971]
MKNKKYLKPAVAIAMALSLAASPTYLGMTSSEVSAATKQASAPVISGEVFEDSSVLSGSTTDKSATTVIVTFSNEIQRFVGVVNGKFSVNIPPGILVAGNKISVRTANNNYKESLTTDVIIKATPKNEPVTPATPALAPQIAGNVDTSSTVLSGVTTDVLAITAIVTFPNGDVHMVGVQNGKFSVNLPAGLVAGGKISVKTANHKFEESIATDVIIQAASNNQPVTPVTPVTPVKPVTPATPALAPQIVGNVDTSSTILSGVTTDVLAITAIVTFPNGDVHMVGVQNGKFSANLPASLLVAGGKISVKTANHKFEESIATDVIIQAAK